MRKCIAAILSVIITLSSFFMFATVFVKTTVTERNLNHVLISDDFLNMLYDDNVDRIETDNKADVGVFKELVKSSYAQPLIREYLSLLHKELVNSGNTENVFVPSDYAMEELKAGIRPSIALYGNKINRYFKPEQVDEYEKEVLANLDSYIAKIPQPNNAIREIFGESQTPKKTIEILYKTSWIILSIALILICITIIFVVLKNKINGLMFVAVPFYISSILFFILYFVSNGLFLSESFRSVTVLIKNSLTFGMIIASVYLAIAIICTIVFAFLLKRNKQNLMVKY